MIESMLMSEEYILVIDTDQFAGSFAADLCAYCTGFVGEEDRVQSRELSDLYYRHLGIEDDESPKGLLADDKNPLRDLVIDHQDENGNWNPWAVWPSRLYGTNTEGKYARLNDSNYDEYNFPAGFSVGIYMGATPTDKDKSIIKNRVLDFFKDIYPKLNKDLLAPKVNVQGYRLIVHKKTAEEMIA